VIFAAASGSVLNLKVSSRCGRRAWARHTRCTLVGISTQLHQAFFDAVVAADKIRPFASLPFPEAMKIVGRIGAEHNMYFTPVDVLRGISEHESAARQSQSHRPPSVNGRQTSTP
jgi:hypothetical protein